MSEEGLHRYIISERDTTDGLTRTNEYMNITEDMEALIEFENDEGLFKISENKDKIKEITSSKKDYLEYRYKYRWVQHVPMMVGKVIIYYQILHIGHSWTADPNHRNLTGEERVVHHVYYGYKIVKDEDGDLKLVQSEMVEHLDDVSDDDIYIKEDFYKKVYSDNKDLEVDYEDGPEEESQAIDDFI